MLKKYLISFVLVCFPISGLASDPIAIQHQLDQIVTKSEGKATVGVIVQSLKTGEIVYQKNANQHLIPASALKILTAYAALRQLGPNYTYKTQLLTDSTQPVANGVLQGNLYIKFAGDPDLTTEALDSIFAAVRAKGIKTITGSLVIDDGQYDNVGIAPGTVYSDKNYCYGVPIDAMNLNRNCISLTVRPAKKVGQKALVSFMDNIPLPLDNTVITQGGGKKACGVWLRYSEDTQQYQLVGCIRAKGRPVSLRVVVNNKAYGRSAVTTLLKRNQMVAQSGVKKLRTPASAEVLATHESKPVKMLVYTMLKKSDNLIANALFKKVGASYFQRPGSWDYGSKAVRALLGNNPQMSVYDGSGLSRFNQVSSAQLLQVLRQAWTDPQVADYFFDGLPGSGEKTGTLKRRMGTPDMLGKVKAKTGTMKGVVSLAGYVETHNREVLAFSIIVNGAGPASQYRRLADNICQVLRTV